MEADDLLCSRNARSRTPLVGRAQWKINQPPSPKRCRASSDGLLMRAMGGQSGWTLRTAREGRLGSQVDATRSKERSDHEGAVR
jgi:hypothetical protein